MVSATNSISQQISAYVDQADELIDALKKEDGKATSKQVLDLLIEYIIANMENDAQEAENVKDQLDSVIKKYGTDIEHANNLEASVDAVKNDPQVQTTSELSSLERLIKGLQLDLQSGNMSNLQSFQTLVTSS